MDAPFVAANIAWDPDIFPQLGNFGSAGIMSSLRQWGER